MIRSMTGYGRAEVAGSRLSLAVECKSLNHRHLDIAIKLPRALSALEIDARRVIQATVQRGRVDIAVSAAPVEGAAAAGIGVDMAQARAYIDIARRAAEQLGLRDELTLDWVLDRPGVISREEPETPAPEDGWPLLHDALIKAMAELSARRQVEGAALAKELRALLSTLCERVQALLGTQPLDEGRLATEVAMWAEKSDITEELARLRAHTDEFSRLLDEGGAVGRTFDFLIQEMNREVNTVASKADDLELSQAAIAAKSTLEKLREQAQNIE